MPEFKRPTLEGRMIETSALRGRPVVIKFFAEYCEPCKRTLPAAERLHRQKPEVSFIGISEDDYASTAGKIGDEYGLTFPIVHDIGKALKGRFRVSDMPMTFVADASGTVRWVGGPAQNEHELEQALEALRE